MEEVNRQRKTENAASSVQQEDLMWEKPKKYKQEKAAVFTTDTMF